MRLSGRIVGVRSTEQSAGIKVGDFCPRHHIFNVNDISEKSIIIGYLSKNLPIFDKHHPIKQLQTVFPVCNKNSRCIRIKFPNIIHNLFFRIDVQRRSAFIKNKKILDSTAWAALPLQKPPAIIEYI